MKESVVLTVLAEDRPGIVRELSEVIATHGGSWQESRMARMAGQFAGILRVECPAERTGQLVGSLDGLRGMDIVVRREPVGEVEGRRLISIDVVGNDRPGIVREISAAIAGMGANMEDLHTALESAPMAGHPLFHAKGVVALPGNLASGALIDAIEAVSADVAVTVEE